LAQFTQLERHVHSLRFGFETQIAGWIMPYFETILFDESILHPQTHQKSCMQEENITSSIALFSKVFARLVLRASLFSLKKP